MATTEPRPASIADLDDETLRRIFGPLSAADTAAGMAVGRQWQRALGDPLLWFRLCRRDYGLGAFPADASADAFDASADYRAAYASWQAAYPDFRDAKPVLRRAVLLWKRLRAWFGAHHPAVLATLQGPASASALDALAGELGQELPPELRALYRVCNGQATAFGAQFDAWIARMTRPSLEGAPADASWRLGLLGGYSFYDMSVCTELLCAERALSWGRRLREQGLRPGLLPLAACGFFKFVCLEGGTGRVLCLDKHRRLGQPLCPAGATVLDWLEQFAARLEAGAYSLAPQPLNPLGLEDGHPQARALSLFPQTADSGMRECVTGGVRVRVSAVWVPEQSLASRPSAGGSSRDFFTYSVRYYLLPAEEQLQQAGAGVTARAKASVQLESRHWVIRDATGQEIDRVDGPGVVGMHPILTPGGEEFVYQSVSQSVGGPSSMEGCFTFVEGTLARPTGPRFNAVCPRFELKVPDYAY